MGVILALVGALAFSFMNVFMRNGVRPGDEDNGLLTTLLVNIAVIAAVLVVTTTLGGVRELSVVGGAWFVAAGLSATFFGRNALFGAIRHIGAARGAAIKNATPLVTVAIALAFLGERLSAMAAAGVGLIIAGLFLLIMESLRGARKPRTAEEDPVDEAIESEALAAAGWWDRTRLMADRTVAAIAEPARRQIVVGVTLGAAAALAFGSGHAFRKVGMDFMPDALLGASIGALTALATYLLTAAVRGRARAELHRSVTSYRPWFWAAGAAGAIGQMSFFSALAFAPVSHVSVVAGSEIVLTVVIAALLARRLEAITSRVVIPAILVFAGTALIGVAG
ncbi:MAG TPA: DMT family transporter [Candidatus Limnocylindria bacterium]|nr:DMT family transporter [Candidatus Limnocylindria bacterium]